MGRPLKVSKKYSHLNGFEWLMYHHQEMWGELEDAIGAIDAETYRTKVSKEKTMLGRKLFSPSDLNAAFREELWARGWEKPERFNFLMSADEDLSRELIKLPYEDQKAKRDREALETYSGFNEADFSKNRVSLEVQFGKYSFVQFDIFVKHAANYMQGKIDLGIEIVPMKRMEQEMSSGPPAYEKHLHEILRQGRIFPPVPLILIGVEP